MPVAGSVSGDNVNLHDSTKQVVFNGTFTDDNTVMGSVTLGSDTGPAT